MSWTEADVARLKAAIASGRLTVRLGERMITYQSTEAMLSVLARMEDEVAAAARPRRATSRYTFTTFRGD